MRTSKRAVHRLIAEAVRSLEAARRIAEAPGEAIRTVGDLGDTRNLFVQAVEFDWSRLDSSIRHLPDFSEMAAIGVTKAPPHTPVPVASDHRRFKFYFPFLESMGEAPVREVDLLDDEGRPAEDAVATVEAWAMMIVELAEGVLGDDEVDDRERRFPEPTTALSPKAHAVRQELLTAWPKGLKGKELAQLLDERHDLPMETSHLSGMIVRELEEAGCPVRNVRGVGYQLVPAGGAE
jgi:hypothetical protein